MPFDLNDCVELLLNLRDEEFSHERCIRLFQFQTWIWYPGKKGIAARDAGRLAAAAVLRKLEEEHKWQGLGGSRQITLEKLQSLSAAPDYRHIFNEFIASQGGWSRLLFTTPWDREFDKRIKGQSEDRASQLVADIVHYRLRAALDPVQQQKRSGTTHAIFFKWSQNRKAFTTRSAWSWWKKFRRSAGFIYLINKRGFPMKPPCSSDDDFTRKLLHPPMSKSRLKTLFSEYQFVTDTLDDENFYTLPARVRSASYNMVPFSTDELAIIKAYDSHSDEMSDPKKGFGTTLPDRAH
jgi:hypothetical protein